MDNDIRILIGLTDLNVDFDPEAEQHFNETNLNGTATITWNLLPRASIRSSSAK